MCIRQLLLFVLLTSPFLVQAATAEDLNECLVDREFGKSHGRATQALIDVVSARSQLESYDRLLEVVPLEERDSPFMWKATTLRFEILQGALSAYYFIGPIHLSIDETQLFEQLVRGQLDYEHYEVPGALEKLVELGYIDHLPQSPYGNDVYLTSVPKEVLGAGSVLYLPIASEEPLLADSPGALEGWLLACFGRELDQPLDWEELQEHFGGDLTRYFSTPPTNIISISGQDFN